ncbi:MAG: SDR family oxidoreductase, partial [Hyphomicrobiaceae bacterium]
IKQELGAAQVVIHNAVRATFGHYDEFDTLELEKNFTVSVSALHKMARFYIPDMLQLGHGTLLVTGNTAAHRGTPRYSMFAPAKAAQRILTEALARRHGPDGIHVAYVTIDAPIKTPWTSQYTQDVPLDGFAMPDDIAEEIWHLAHQRRSTWSSDLWIRPFREAF